MPRLRHALLALLLAAPALLAAEPDTPLADDSVFYPRNSPQAGKVAESEDAYPTWAMLVFIGALAGGGYYLMRRGNLRSGGNVQVRQRLAIEETKALGNKQYLAVAAYGERKFLLAVCPGRIDLLTKLDEVEAGANLPKSAPVAVPGDS